jgi:hypothetical protein
MNDHDADLVSRGYSRHSKRRWNVGTAYIFNIVCREFRIYLDGEKFEVAKWS